VVWGLFVKQAGPLRILAPLPVHHELLVQLITSTQGAGYFSAVLAVPYWRSDWGLRAETHRDVGGAGGAQAGPLPSSRPSQSTVQRPALLTAR